jgi:pSer/pThr/pTyr-binding forkhead associated (FHA) protein
MRRVTLEVAFSPPTQAAGKAETLALTWIFPGQTLVVGRSREECDLALQHDGSISKRHFEIAFDGTTCMLRDLGTTNGTFVNGRSVQETELVDGDKIEVGKTRFTLGVLDMPDSVTAEPEIEQTWRRPPQAAGETPAAVTDPRAGDRPSLHRLPPAPARVAPSSAAERPSIADSAAADRQADTADLEQPAERRPRTDYGFVTLAVTAGPFLSVQQDELSRQLIWIRSGQRIRVGRSVWDADWVIPADPMISGLHFEIHYDGERCQIVDLRSSNGTFVNGDQVSSAQLNSGDTIRAGETTFELQFA